MLQFLGYVRHNWLMMVKGQLPKSLMDHSWTTKTPARCVSAVLNRNSPDTSLVLTSQLLQRLHKLHQAARYRKSLSPAKKALFEQKLLLSQARAMPVKLVV